MSRPRFPPLYRVGQLLFMQRMVKSLRKGEQVKVKAVREVIGGYRYQVETEVSWEWCYEHDLGKSLPDGAVV